MTAKQSSGKKPKMKRKDYEKELRALQVELCHLQGWVKATGARIIILFEGRDAAGKGGTIKAITERVSPRVFRAVALPAPSDREKTQMFMQRYIQQFPAAGEVVIFDRSWYNRAGVEYVMGFCTPEQHERFLELCPEIEKLREHGLKQSGKAVEVVVPVMQVIDHPDILYSYRLEPLDDDHLVFRLAE
ncbi:MAG: polyphosphate kinase 2, partial [Rhodomicrobium sp.]